MHKNFLPEKEMGVEREGEKIRADHANTQIKTRESYERYGI